MKSRLCGANNINIPFQYYPIMDSYVAHHIATTQLTIYQQCSNTLATRKGGLAHPNTTYIDFPYCKHIVMNHADNTSIDFKYWSNEWLRFCSATRPPLCSLMLTHNPLLSSATLTSCDYTSGRRVKGQLMQLWPRAPTNSHLVSYADFMLI